MNKNAVFQVGNIFYAFECIVGKTAVIGAVDIKILSALILADPVDEIVIILTTC